RRRHVLSCASLPSLRLKSTRSRHCTRSSSRFEVSRLGFSASTASPPSYSVLRRKSLKTERIRPTLERKACYGSGLSGSSPQHRIREPLLRRFSQSVERSLTTHRNCRPKISRLQSEKECPWTYCSRQALCVSRTSESSLHMAS